MTTIVGLQGDNFAVVYVDSRISSSDSGGYISQISTLKEGCGKVAVNGKYLLGAAGDVRAINILHHVFQPPTPPINMRGKKLDQFFTAKFIPALRECFVCIPFRHIHGDSCFTYDCWGILHFFYRHIFNQCNTIVVHCIHCFFTKDRFLRKGMNSYPIELTFHE